MTDCTNVAMRERLPELLHDALDAEAAAALHGHLAGCAPCSAELARLREARAVMARVPTVDVARIVAALPAPPVRSRLELSRGGAAPVTRPVAVPARAASSRWRRLAVAAGLLLAVGVSGVSLARLGDPAAPAEQVTLAAAADDRLLAVNVVGLTEDDFAGLLDELDDLEALPDSDPRPFVPVESALGSEGGEGGD